MTALGAVLVLVVGLVLAFAWLPDPGAPAAEPSLELEHDDGLVIAAGSDFPQSALVQVSADFDGGSGSAALRADDAGDFVVAFRPPAGFTGNVRVTAESDAVSSQSMLDVRADNTEDGGTGADRAEDDSLLIVPTTGPQTDGEPEPSDQALPRHEVPAAITADCSDEVTEDLQGWLDTVPDGSHIDFPRDACYWIDGSLMLEGRHDLVIAGNGTTFRAKNKMPEDDPNRAQWWLQYGSNITLRDMRLTGVNPVAQFDEANEWDHNVFIRGTDTVTIENVHGRNTYGDFIAIAQAPDQVTIPRDITIRDVSADTVGRMGISCVACDGVSVDNSVFNNIAYHVFDLEVQGDDWPGRNIRYTNNTIGEHGWAFFSVGTPYQTFDNDISDLYIAGNTMTDAGEIGDKCLPAISFVSSKIHARDVTIENNSLLSHTDAVAVKRASSVIVRDNEAELVEPTCGDPVGVRMTGVDDVHVHDNELVGFPTS
ncbi:hypothetical protein [Blastococcus sp. SYSU DS0973]